MYLNLLKTNILFAITFIIALLSNSVEAEVIFTDKEDTISYDEANHHYIIRYVGQDGELHEVLWHPFTDINVYVESKYRASSDGIINYTYKIQVNSTSRLALEDVHFYALSVDKTSIKYPQGWRIYVRNTFDKSDPTQLISWTTTTNPVQAGNEEDGFELKSMALPVYNILYVRGETDSFGYVDDGPKNETSSYIRDELIAKNFEGKAYNTAIPLIPVSSNFNAIETYSAFHQSLLDYIEKDYIDPILATNFTKASSAVLNALKSNDINDALSKLMTFKKLVEGEYANYKGKTGHNEKENSKPQSIHLKEILEILKFNIAFISKKLQG